jgi:hypothetical protein
MLLIAIAESLPMAVGVALSPVPIAAVLIMLLTARARTNGPAFLVGWVLGIGAVGLVVFLMPGLETSRGEPTRLAGFARIVLGTLLVALSVRQWSNRPPADGTVETPDLLRRLDDLGFIKAALAGFVLSGLNVKNLALTAAAAASIDASMLGWAGQTIAFLCFGAIASLTIAVPVVGFFVFRTRAELLFSSWKDWLLRNNMTVMALLLLVFGILILSRGLRIIAV